MFCNDIVFPDPEGPKIIALIDSFPQWGYLLCLVSYSFNCTGLNLGKILSVIMSFYTIYKNICLLIIHIHLKLMLDGAILGGIFTGAFGILGIIVSKLTCYYKTNGKPKFGAGFTDKPLLEDPIATTITFASDLVYLDNEDAILYAQPNDSFVRAYRLNASKIKELLPKSFINP